MRIPYLIRIMTLISLLGLVIGCGDQKMRKRIARLDDATLAEVQDDYPPNSKEGILIAKELKRRTAKDPAPKDIPSVPDMHEKASEPRSEPSEPNETLKPSAEFRTAGYYKSDDRHRIFAYYPLRPLDREGISKDIWDTIMQVGLSEMHTAGRTTRVFFYLDEKSALAARLNQHSSHEAALQGAYYAKPFASVETMFDGKKWLTKYPETSKEEVIKLQ